MKHMDNKKQIFIEKSNKLHNNKYDYSLVEYFNSKTKVKIICPNHGIFEQCPSDHSTRYGCKKCYGNDKKTKEEFIKKSNLIHNDKYKYDLVEYINNKTKVKIICPNHGVFEVRPDNHTNTKSGCPKCANNILYNKSDFTIKANIIHNNKYDYSLVNYKTGHIKIKIICPIHGEFEQKPFSHLLGIGCKKCGTEKVIKKLKSNNEEFIKKSNKKHKNKYDYSLVDYTGTSTKIKIICKKHGEFEQLPGNHIRGQGCPLCKEQSRGEKTIKNYLINKKIKHFSQKKFTNCKNKKELPFDFYLPDYNLCIEYDGEQHSKIISIWGNKDSLIKQQERDQIKNDFCKENNIKLLRIPYTEIDSIEQKLNDFLLF